MERVWIGTRYLGRLSRYGYEGRERGISSLVMSDLVLYVSGKAETKRIVIVSPL